MKRSRHEDSAEQSRSPVRLHWLWILLTVGALLVLIGLFRFWRQEERTSNSAFMDAGAPDGTAGPAKVGRGRVFRRGAGSATATAPTAEEIVAGKVAQFARSRRELAHLLAQKHGVEVSDDVERFFDAVQSGNWDEIEARYKVINGGDSSAGHAAGRPPEVAHVWPAIVDAYGAAEQAHLWPAQKLLD